MSTWRDACPAGDKCPMSRIHVTPETENWRVVLAFLLGSHQERSEGPVFTAEQLALIEHETTTWPTKLQEFRKDLENYIRKYDGAAVAPSTSTAVVNDSDHSLACEFERLDVSREYSNRSQRSNGPGKGFFATKKAPVKQDEPEPPAPEPAVVPVGAPRIRFGSFLDKGRPYLTLKKTDFLGGTDVDVQHPLGACYDHIREQFVVADEKNHRVVLVPSQTFIFDESLIKAPSSVCVVEPGVSLAILCASSIILYMYDCGSVRVLHTTHNRNYFRGLTLTPAGNLLTLLVSRGPVEICIFGTEELQTTPKYTIPLPNARCPSFLDMYHTTLVITDLGTQSVFLCKLDDTMAHQHNEPLFRVIQQKEPQRWNCVGEPFGAFNFVSGVYIDAEFQILIADAGGHTFQLFDQNLEFLHRVGVDFSVYVSSFAINSNGILMACDRRSSHLVFSQLTSTEEVLPLKPGPRGGNGGGRGRGGGFRGRGNANNRGREGGAGRGGGVFNGFQF